MVAQVPFVDVLTTMLDDSLRSPWASGRSGGIRPAPTPTDDDVLFPLRQRACRRHPTDRPFIPPMLATAGLHDPRVGYWEPASG